MPVIQIRKPRLKNDWITWFSLAAEMFSAHLVGQLYSVSGILCSISLLCVGLET